MPLADTSRLRDDVGLLDVCQPLAQRVRDLSCRLEPLVRVFREQPLDDLFQPNRNV